MFKGSPEKIDKKLILDLKSQEELWLHYFPTVDFNENFRSPLRQDRSATCSMFWHENGNLWMCDHSGAFKGDIFAAIMHGTSMTFQECLIKVYNDVIKGQYNGYQQSNIPSVVAPPKLKRRIRVEFREFEDYDLAYWEQYGFDIDLLRRLNIYAALYVFLSNKITGEMELVFINNKNNPIYAYRWPNFEYKIYLPKSNDIRFICNTTKWNAWDLLPKSGDLVFIQKSLKDIGTLLSIDYHATGPQSESVILDTEKVADLKRRFKRVIIWYDNDKAGRENAQKHAEEFDLMWIEIPEEVGCKDPSDFHAEFGPQELINLIENLIGI